MGLQRLQQPPRQRGYGSGFLSKRVARSDLPPPRNPVRVHLQTELGQRSLRDVGGQLVRLISQEHPGNIGRRGPFHHGLTSQLDELVRPFLQLEAQGRRVGSRLVHGGLHRVVQVEPASGISRSLCDEGSPLVEAHELQKDVGSLELRLLLQGWKVPQRSTSVVVGCHGGLPCLVCGGHFLGASENGIQDLKDPGWTSGKGDVSIRTGTAVVELQVRLRVGLLDDPGHMRRVEWNATNDGQNSRGQVHPIPDVQVGCLIRQFRQGVGFDTVSQVVGQLGEVALRHQLLGYQKEKSLGTGTHDGSIGDMLTGFQKLEDIADRLGIPVERVRAFIRTSLVRVSQGMVSIEDVIAVREAEASIGDLPTMLTELAALKAEVLRHRSIIQFVLRVAGMQQRLYELSDAQLLQLAEVAKLGKEAVPNITSRTFVRRTQHLVDLCLYLTDREFRRLERLLEEPRCWKVFIFLLEDVDDAIGGRPDLLQRPEVQMLRVRLNLARQHLVSQAKFVLALNDPFCDPKEVLGEICTRAAKFELIPDAAEAFDPSEALRGVMQEILPTTS